jgi:hypothetical protein
MSSRTWIKPQRAHLTQVMGKTGAWAASSAVEQNLPANGMGFMCITASCSDAGLRQPRHRSISS